MSRSKRKRNRRHWNKAKQQTQNKTACTCHAEKYQGVHTNRCPAYAPVCNCNAEQYKGAHLASCPASYSSKSGTSYSYSSGDWGGSSWCSKHHWRSPVNLLDGKTVLASAWGDRPKTVSQSDVTEENLDFGFYLDDLWTGNRMTASPGIELPVTASDPKVIHYPCTDQMAPQHLDMFKAMIEWILEQITEGKTIDIGCIGGHGRTGLTLSCLLVAQGMNPWDAINKIRDEYCSQAVETFTQEKFVGTMWSAFNGGEEPPQSTLKAQASKTSYHTTEPIMNECPNCGNAVYFLDTHRGMCKGHPTDEELAAAGVAAETQKGPLKNIFHKCIHEGCEITVYDQPVHDKAVHSDLYYAAPTVREQNSDIPEMSNDEADYQEWLRLNASELKRMGALLPEEEHAIEESIDNLEWDKRMIAMDEACPYGACMYPFECEPTEGQCFRQLTDTKSPSWESEAAGWAGGM